MNQSTKAFAEAVDLYPTIAELAGLPDPATQGQQLNGTSLAPVFDDPSNASGVKDAAFAQFAKVCWDCVFNTKLLFAPWHFPTCHLVR